MKFKTILVAAVMFLGLTAAAFAQATFSVGSIPVTTVTNTGQTERTGDITFTQISGTSNLGTITIAYGVPITIAMSSVTVTGTGGYAGNVSVNTGASNNASGLLVINLPAGVGAGTIVVSGVRVAIAGTSLTNLVASISSVGNAIVAGQTNVTVISSIAAGIASVGTGDTASSATIQGVSGAITGSAVVTVTEGYLDAFKVAGTGDTTSVLLRITLDKAPPAGVTVAFPATAVEEDGPGVWESCNSSGSATASYSFTSGSTSLSAYYRIATATDPTLVETVTIPVGLSVSGSATFPIPATVVSYKASLAPVGTAFSSSGAVITSPIPRFAALDVGPATLFTVIGSQTTLLFPLSQFVNLGPNNVYDTGISIANTTTDPGTTPMGGIVTAPKQAGKVTFYFYPQLATPGGTMPTPFSYTTTAGSPGTGLDSSGNLPSGSTYTVLLSQLLAAAGYTGDFQGYIFAITGFTNAHGIYVLSNFAGFSQGASALVITSNRTVVPEALNN